MNKVKFETAKKEYDYTKRKEQIQSLLTTRTEFVRYFNRDKLKEMRLEDYCLGLGNKDWHCFCYAIEQTFSDLGCILGATARKFGIYYSSSTKEYVFSQKFGETKMKAFNAVKRAIIDLLDCGKAGDLQGIADNPFSSMVKGKILSLYYPEKYLNIFSDDHLDKLLIALGIDNDELLESKPVFKRQALMEFKNNDPDMKHWQVDKFASFLYDAYPTLDPNDGGGEEDDDKRSLSDGPITQHREESTQEVERKHKQMQNRIKEILLSEGYYRVYLENQRVDIKGMLEDGTKHFFEVKTGTAKECIREALGQILEYNHYPSITRATKMFIIGPNEPTMDDKDYLEKLRNTYKELKLWYRWYSFEDNKLHEEV